MIHKESKPSNEYHPRHFERWLKEVFRQQWHYRILRDRQLNNDALTKMYQKGYTPTEALNALIEVV